MKYHVITCYSMSAHPSTSTLGERAYHALLQRLRNGALKPGDQLVNRKLAADLGLSITPVREAIGRLASEGIIEYVRGGGAFVRTIGRQELAQLYDLRETIEPFAAAQAATNASAHDVDLMLSICRDWALLVEELRSQSGGRADEAWQNRWDDNEERFHNLLFESSRNLWLQQIARNLRIISAAFAWHRREPGLIDAESAALTCQDHLQLAHAVRDRKPAAARKLMQEHIAIGRTHVLDYFDRRAAQAGLVRH